MYGRFAVPESGYHQRLLFAIVICSRNVYNIQY